MIFRFFLLAIIISQSAGAQTAPKDISKPFLFVDSIFKNDRVTAEIIEFTYPPEITDIVLRFQKALQENKEWTEEYFSKYYKPGEGLPYHEKMGISREEYQKIKDLDKTRQKISVSSTALVKVDRTGDKISFKTADMEMKFIDFLTIDIKKQIVIFHNDTIPFDHELNVDSSPFGEWHGYQWKKSIANMGENDDLKMDKLVSTITEIIFGKITSSGNFFFRFQYKDIDRGKVKANLELIGYLK